MYKISKDGDGFLAEIVEQNNLFAFGNTEEEAKKELAHVIDMMIDYHQEVISNEKKYRLSLS